jgi:hypothetical protein
VYVVPLPTQKDQWSKLHGVEVSESKGIFCDQTPDSVHLSFRLFSSSICEENRLRADQRDRGAPDDQKEGSGQHSGGLPHCPAKVPPWRCSQLFSPRRPAGRQQLAGLGDSLSLIPSTFPQLPPSIPPFLLHQLFHCLCLTRLPLLLVTSQAGRADHVQCAQVGAVPVPHRLRTQGGIRNSRPLQLLLACLPAPSKASIPFLFLDFYSSLLGSRFSSLFPLLSSPRLPSPMS